MITFPPLVTSLSANLIVLAGLVLTAVSAVRFLRGSSSVRIPALDDQQSRLAGPLGGVTALAVPPLLVFVGFLVSSAVRSAYAIVAALLVAAVASGALHLLRMMQRQRNRASALAGAARGECAPPVPGPAVAVVLLTAVLTLVGSLLAVRLVVAPDPSTDLVHAVTTAATVEFGPRPRSAAGRGLNCADCSNGSSPGCAGSRARPGRHRTNRLRHRRPGC